VQVLAELCIRRPVFASMLILSLVVVGAAGYLSLDVDRFPSVDLPAVRIRTALPGASPAEMEALVSQPIEEAVNAIEGIRELRSVNGAGASFVIVTFELERDIDAAAQDVRDRVATVLRDLPRDMDPPTISKQDIDQSPVITIALTGERSQRELTELALRLVKPRIERSPGVGEVEVVGGLERVIQIRVDAARLAAYRLPIAAVRDAIASQNANPPGGIVTGPFREQTLRTMGRVEDPRDFAEIVVAERGGSPVRVRDIATVEDGTQEQRTLARLDGVPTVSIEIQRQSGANTVAVIDGVKERLAAVAAELPEDVRLEVIRDQSRFIDEALHEIQKHLVLGSVLACLVVLLFMRNWRAMVIAAVAIPTSTIAAFAVMRALDFTLNSVTMLALVLMVGIVIDDAIVVLENIFRFIEEKKKRPFEAAKAATAEIGLAVLATTLSLVVIFVPVSFMSSVSGRFLYQFGITAAAAVLVSLLVSFTLTPMMSARLLRSAGGSGHGGPARSRRGFYGLIDRAYTAVLAASLRRRLAVTAAMALIVVSAVPLYRRVPQEFLPSDVDEGEFEVNVTAPEGTGLAAIDAVAERVEAELREVRGVRTVLATVGSGFLGGLNNARFYVRLAPHEERTFRWSRLLAWPPWGAFEGNYSQRDVQQEVRARLRRIPDVRASVRGAQNFLGGGPNTDIDFILLGPELTELAAYADRLRERAPELGLQDADTTLKLDKPELRVEIDRERAADLGVDTEEIAGALRILVGGDTRVTRYRDEAMNEDYDVEVRLRPEDRADPATISRLYVARENGELARLDNVVRMEATETPSRIDRMDRQRAVSLRAAVAPGFAQKDRIEALRAEVAAMDLPTGYSTRVSGRARELETTFREFIVAFALSVVLMYIILAAQFESIVHPFTILLSLPLSLPFAFISLIAANQTLNLYSALGLLVLFGIVKKNAILQIDHMNHLLREGVERTEAIITANRERLRPILMTTLTLIAGMLPMAVGTGPGAEERRSVAIVVIGGQALCLFLTLVATPVVYSLLDDLRLRVRGRARAGGGGIAGEPAAVLSPQEPRAE